MRFIFYAAFIVFTLLCIIIAVSNSAPVVFSLNPLPINIGMPAFGLVFIGIFIGLFGGWIVSIYSGIAHARRHRLADKKIRELEKRLNSPEQSNIDLSKDEKHGKTPSE
tara:strand:+ start:13010 stop:13336 length:327 start_codon:yes stop_codon:yes gene_type:complete